MAEGSEQPHRPTNQGRPDTRRTWGTIVSLILVGAEVMGRVYLVQVGIAPSSGADLFKIVVGGVIAVGFIVYVGLRSFADQYDPIDACEP